MVKSMADDFLARAAKKQRNEESISGMFDCQICRKLVQTANYDRPAGILTWECPDGHKSEIKEFDIR